MKEALHDIQNPSWEPKVEGGRKQRQADREKQRKNERGKNTTQKLFLFFFKIKLIFMI